MWETLLIGPKYRAIINNCFGLLVVIRARDGMVIETFSDIQAEEMTRKLSAASNPEAMLAKLDRETS